MDDHEIRLRIDGIVYYFSMSEGWEISIGRDVGKRVRFVDDIDVSTHHASLAYDRRGWWAEDRSRNGTLLDGSPLRERRPLRERHELRLPAVTSGTPHVLVVERLCYPHAVATGGPEDTLADLLLEKTPAASGHTIHVRLRDEVKHRPAPPIEPRPAELLWLCLEAGKNPDGAWLPVAADTEYRLFGNLRSEKARAARDKARQRLREWWSALLKICPPLAEDPDYAELISRREPEVRLLIRIGRAGIPGPFSR
jgi:hypothetical protein